MIKQLKKTDIELVNELLSSADRKIGSIENIEAFLSNESNYFIAYLEKGKIVGYLLAYVLQRYDGRNQMLYLHEIDVLQSHRKRGIASQLMNELIKIRHSLDYDKIFLITNKSNKAAVALYESCNGKVHADDDVLYSFQ